MYIFIFMLISQFYSTLCLSNLYVIISLFLSLYSTSFSRTDIDSYVKSGRCLSECRQVIGGEVISEVIFKTNTFIYNNIK